MEKKVLHFQWSGSIGGTARSVHQLVISQMKNTHYIPSIAFAQAGEYYFEEAGKIGCGLISLNLKNDRNIFYAWGIKSIIEKYHIHHFHNAEITMMLASLLCPNAIRIYTQRGGRVKRRGGKKLRHKIVSWYLRNYFHGLSGNTQYACDFAASLFNIEPRLWHVTYNGVDFSLLKPKRQKEEVLKELRLPFDGTAIIGTSGYLRDYKRIDLLLRACAQLPHNLFRLLIVGDGPANNELQKLSSELGIADRTIITGMKKHIGDYINIMDIFVLPSNVESFGNSAVEAMSRGLPTIVFNTGGGLLEHIQNGINGYIVASIDELAKRLKSLISNRSLRSQLGKNAKEFVTSTYTLERMVSSYNSLYEVAENNKIRKDT